MIMHTPAFLRAVILSIALCSAPQVHAETTMVSIFPEDDYAAEQSNQESRSSTQRDSRSTVIQNTHATRSGIHMHRSALPPHQLNLASRAARTPWFAAPRLSDYITEARTLRRAPPRSLKNASALGCIAVAIYHEARGEPVAGQYAVASVIMQRALVRDRWGDTPCDVVRPVQFSFMTSRYGFTPIREEVAWARAIDIAGRSLVSGPLPDLANADHYHARSVDPSWNETMEQVAVIGDHLFFRDPDSLTEF